MPLKKIKKLYYSIGDVSDITSLKQYVLRYWETEFSILSPSKNSAGNRIYKDADIKIIKHIQDLLYTKKFTIKGAKQYLNDYYKNESSKSKILHITNNIDIKVLDDIKKDLNKLIKLVEDLKD